MIYAHAPKLQLPTGTNAIQGLELCKRYLGCTALCDLNAKVVVLVLSELWTPFAERCCVAGLTLLRPQGRRGQSRSTKAL